jgi:predicted acyl esterase
MLFDVGDDGSSVYLAQQVSRARYREGLRVEKLIDTTEPLRYDFDRFFFVSRRIARGHRLRLMIGPNHSIYWQKNYNSGKPNAEETMQDARPVTVKLFHDAAHPSALYVPIGHAED